MAHPDLLSDPPPSISAAELRRRLLSSTPPPTSASSDTLDFDAMAAQSEAAQAGPPRTSGIIRLTMPGTNGPVAAASLPPITIPTTQGGPQPPPGYRSRASGALDPASMAIAGITGSTLGVVANKYPAPNLPTTGMPSNDLGGSRLIQIPPATSGASSSANPTAEDYKRVRHENRELRKLLEEMKTLLQEASENEQKTTVREQDLLGQMQIKQRQLDELTEQMQAIEDQVASGALAPAPAVPKTRSELDEWADDLEKENSKLTQERRKIEDERKQLRDDEESLETQMRQMEVSMARERALMARQESELKRLSAEIQHELDLMQRGDVALRDQLSKFQRRAADVLQTGKPSGPPPGGRR